MVEYDFMRNKLFNHLYKHSSIIKRHPIVSAYLLYNIFRVYVEGWEYKIKGSDALSGEMLLVRIVDD